MEIYPIHLRKKRVEQMEKTTLEKSVVKLNEDIQSLVNDFDNLKQFLNHLDEKYKMR